MLYPVAKQLVGKLDSQTKLSAADYHEYLNKKLVTKAINGLDVISLIKMVNISGETEI